MNKESRVTWAKVNTQTQRYLQSHLHPLIFHLNTDLQIYLLTSDTLFLAVTEIKKKSYPKHLFCALCKNVIKIATQSAPVAATPTVIG